MVEDTMARMGNGNASNRLPISAGVFAHNEEASVRACLDSVAHSRCRRTRIDEILVVSSGSSDRTDELVAECCSRYAGMRLLREPHKRGKVSAVNLFLAQACNEHCVMVNADTVLDPEALDNLCSPLFEPDVGMVGGHPIPLEPRRGYLAVANRLFWELHHELCLRAPKMGELVAFRHVFDRLPEDHAGADEDWIHGEVLRCGLRVVYAPSAILYNAGPSTLGDFMRHRKRLAVQHLVLSHRCAFTPSSRDLRLMTRLTWDYVRRHPEQLLAVGGVAALELGARTWAWISYSFCGDTQQTWRPLASGRRVSLSLPRGKDNHPSA